MMYLNSITFSSTFLIVYFQNNQTSTECVVEAIINKTQLGGRRTRFDVE